MSISKKPYKGCRDFYPVQMRLREYIFQKVKDVVARYAYEPYDGPMLEEVDLYLAKSGEELINEQIYSFTDRGKRKVAIRPEMTPTVARMVANVHRETPKPIRWFSIPNLMRYERPQRGRLREHWQINADIFGASEEFSSCEILQMLIDIFNSLGANHTHFNILINDRRIVDGFFKTYLQLDNESVLKLYKIIDKSKKVSQEALDKMLSDLFSKSETIDHVKNYLELNSFEDLHNFIQKYQLEDESKTLNSLLEQFEELGLKQYLCYDSSIVRGLDYYTGIVFEAFDLHPDNRRALCGGGAYANLLQIFNEKPLPGIGFGLGDVTLTDFLETHKLIDSFDSPPVDLFISYQDDAALSKVTILASQLRKHQLNVELYPEKIKIKKVFDYTKKKGIQFACLTGSDELEKEIFQIKNLANRENLESSNIQDIIEFIKKKEK